jgi:3-oxoacyl-[acyl-carrier protein] reductase
VATDTPMLPTFMSAGDDEAEARKRFIASIPWGRLNRPEDIARAAVFLASSDAEMVTGTAFEVDGGRDI